MASDFKFRRNPESCTPYLITTSNSSDSTNNTRMNQKEKIELKARNCISKISQAFMQETISALHDFIEDNSNDVLQFSNITKEQVQFVKYVHHTSGDFFFLVSPDVIGAVKSLYKSLSKYYQNQNKMLFQLGKLDKSTKTSVSGKQNEVAPNNHCYAAPSMASKDISAARSVSKERKNKPIYFQSAGLDKPSDTDPQTENNNNEECKTETKDISHLTLRKAKLIEAMSTPMESDRAMRMMKLMGWDGGALGLRGEGIVEPIIPALEIMPGRGLGHTNAGHSKASVIPNRKPRKPVQFRVQVLERILDMLQYNASNSEIEYEHPLDRKEKKFITTALNAFNKRQNMSLESEREKVLLYNIMQEMLCAQVKLMVDFESNKVKLTMSGQKATGNLPKTLAKSEILTGNAVPHTVKETPNETAQTFNVKINNNVAPKKEIAYDRAVGLVNNTIVPNIPRVATELPMKSAPIQKRLQNSDVATEKKIEGAKAQDLVQPNQIPYTDITQEDIHSIIEDYNLRVAYSKLKSATSMAYKMAFLTSMLDFVRSVEKEREFRFDITLDMKLIDYLIDVVDRVNKKKTKGLNTPMEVEVLKNVISVVNITKYNLHIQINKLKTKYRLRKDFFTKRYLNSTVNSSDSPTNFTSLKITLKNVNNDRSLYETTCNESEVVRLEDYKYSDNDQRNLDEGMKCVESLTKDDNILNGSVDTKAIETTEDCLENNENTTDLSPCSKRCRRESEDFEDVHVVKKAKYDFQRLLIVPQGYPDQTISSEEVEDIQTMISDSIHVSSKFLPVLSCNGIQDGGLAYNCHNKNTTDWLEDIIRDTSLKIIDFNNNLCHPKIIIKINSFVKIDAKSLFSKIELYNAGLKTENWKVIEVTIYEGFIIFIVEINVDSLIYIKERGSSLFIGIDKAMFSIVTE